MKKESKKSNKVQGSKADRAAMSNTQSEVKSDPQGMGDTFADAVGGLKQQADDLKGSKGGFLGVENKTIDPKVFNHSIKKEKKD